MKAQTVAMSTRLSVSSDAAMQHNNYPNCHDRHTVPACVLVGEVSLYKINFCINKTITLIVD